MQNPQQPQANAATKDHRSHPFRDSNGIPFGGFFNFADFPLELQNMVWIYASLGSPQTFQIVADDRAVQMVGTGPKIPGLLHATSGARTIAQRTYERVDNFGHFVRQAGPAGLNNNGPVGVAPMAPPPPLPAHQLPARIRNQIRALRGPRKSRLDRSKVILLGAFPVIAGNVVGYCNEADPMHHLLRDEDILPGPIKPPHFYVNFVIDMFKLQIGGGDPQQYTYPSFSLGVEKAVTRCKRKLQADEHSTLFHNLLLDYRPPAHFTTGRTLPPMFDKIQNLVFNITLPPRIDESESSEWASQSAQMFLSSPYIRNTLRHFSGLYSIDFYLPGDHRIHPGGNNVLKHHTKVTVRESDGMTLSSPQLNMLEVCLEIEMAGIRTVLGKDYLPTPRLLVYVPEKNDRMEYDRDYF